MSETFDGGYPRSGVLSANDGLINPAYDKFLDGHPTRRELQKAFNKMGKNDAELFSMVDTQALVGNFLCDKLGVTRAEIEAYVAKKAEELKNVTAARLAAEKAAKDADNTAQEQVEDVVSNSRL